MPTQNLPGLLLDHTHSLARGLVGWWPMNEGAGNRVNDISENNNNGVVTGVSQSATSGWTGGPLGRAFRFDATDDLINAPHSESLNFAAEFSVSCWASIKSTTNYQTLVMKGNGGEGYPAPFHLMYELTLNRWNFNTGDGSAQNITAGTTVVVNRTYHIVGVHTGGADSGATDLIYQDGVLVASRTTEITVSNAGTTLAIGGRTPGTIYGLEDRAYNVRVWNRALSALEVAQLYVEPMAGAVVPRAARSYRPLLFKAAWAARANQIIGGSTT